MSEAHAQLGFSNWDSATGIPQLGFSNYQDSATRIPQLGIRNLEGGDRGVGVGVGGDGGGLMTLGWMSFEDVRGTHATASYRDNMVWPNMLAGCMPL